MVRPTSTPLKKVSSSSSIGPKLSVSSAPDHFGGISISRRNQRTPSRFAKFGYPASSHLVGSCIVGQAESSNSGSIQIGEPWSRPSSLSA